MDAHFATFKDTPMGLNDDEEPYALYVEGRVGRFRIGNQGTLFYNFR